jgi:hypothetical protein
MGLKGYGLWVMGQLDSNVQSPTSWCGDAVVSLRAGLAHFTTLFHSKNIVRIDDSRNGPCNDLIPPGESLHVRYFYTGSRVLAPYKKRVPNPQLVSKLLYGVRTRLDYGKYRTCSGSPRSVNPTCA